MKGFTPRERNGLIALSTIVLAVLMVGFAGPDACTRSEEFASPPADKLYDPKGADIKEQTKAKPELQDSTVKVKSKKRKTQHPRKSTPDNNTVPQRSLRDEHLTF